MKGLIASGKYRLEYIHLKQPAFYNGIPIIDYTEIIGYVDSEYYYLLPEVSVKAVAKSQSDNTLSITTIGVRKSLFSKGFIPEKNVRKRFGGNQLDVWHFEKGRFTDNGTMA